MVLLDRLRTDAVVRGPAVTVLVPFVMSSGLTNTHVRALAVPHPVADPAE